MHLFFKESIRENRKNISLGNNVTFQLRHSNSTVISLMEFHVLIPNPIPQGNESEIVIKTRWEAKLTLTMLRKTCMLVALDLLT